MNDMATFVEKIGRSVGCYYHFNRASNIYSLKLNDSMKRGSMGVFGWARELRRKELFEISTYKWLGDKAGVSQLADDQKKGMHFVSKKKDRDGMGTGLIFNMPKAGDGKKFSLITKAIIAIMRNR